MKIDKRKKYLIVLDTETTASIPAEENAEKGLKEKIIYDIGYSIITKKEIVLKRNYLVKEIFDNEELMNNAYFTSKIPLYNKMIKEGKIEKKPFAEIIKILQKDIQEYNATVFGAYNVGFDLDALMFTTNYLYPHTFQMFFKLSKKGTYYPDTMRFCKTYIFKKDLEIWDIWTMASIILCNQVSFQTYYKELTPRGNFRTNAEIVYNYITDQKNFEEEHTALSDSIIESEILFRILRNHKSIENKFQFMPFRLVKERV